MRILILGLGLLFLTALPAFTADIDAQALQAAHSFTSTIDDGNIQAAYWAGSPLLRVMNPEQEWFDQTLRSQQVLGKVLERTLNRIRAVASQSLFPDDDYRQVYFETRTERKAKAAEVILLHSVEGVWQVCDYAIY